MATIELLKQMRVVERRELERRGEATRAGGKEVQTMDASTFTKLSPTSSIPIINTLRDFSSLSSGIQNPWGSLQRHKLHTQPHYSQQPIYNTFHSYQYLPGNQKIKTPTFYSPPAVDRVIETVHHPFGIRPNKPIITLPTRTRDTSHAQSASACSPVASSPLTFDIQCPCGRLLQVSRVVPSLHTTSLTISLLLSCISNHIPHSFSIPSLFFPSLRFL
jgi:hypothetical protein